MARLERLLEYLDQPGVSEIVIGVDRPIAIRVDGAFRAVSPQPFAREHIVDLLDGTSLSGLIDSPESLPGLEVNACARWLVVEVVRRGAEAALRISLPISQSAPPPRGSTIDPPTTRFKTPVSGVPTTSTRTPATGVPITNSTRTPASGVPITGSRTPASGVPITSSRTPASGVPVTSSRTPASGVPVTSASAVGTARSPTSAPAAGGPARGTTTPPVGVPATPPSNTSYPVSTTNVPRGFDATDIPTSRIPLTKSGETGTLPIPMTGDVPAELLISEPGEIEVLLLTDTWTGPRILDERANVAALVPLIRAARNAGATDLHLAAGRAIMIRRVGELTNLDVANLPAGVSPGLRAALSGPLSAGTAKGLLWPLLGPSGQKQLMNVGYVDLAVEVPGAGRVRINVSRQQEGLCGTFRLIIQHTPTLDTLGLPRELSKVISHHQGLVVIAGPNGHGKTSTMAALVDQLNATKKHHIITIEEPVEVEHEPKLAIVSHREVLRHTLNFVAALKASLREDPDVIVIGELRDAETVEIALTAAETGHLVLATMSTPSAAKTIDRLIDMFPPDDQPQVRASISGTLRAVIAQRLLPNVDGTAMVAAVELVTGVLPLASMIRDNKLYQLPNLMQRGRAFGMMRLDDSLLDLVKANKITDAVALEASENKKELASQIATARGKPPTTPPHQTQSKGLFGRHKARE